MASDDDPLSMSLDDIIKLKRQNRRGSKSNSRGGRGRGRGRSRGTMNPGNADHQYTDFPRGKPGEMISGRGRAGGGSRGFGNPGRGGRGLRVLTSRFGNRVFGTIQGARVFGTNQGARGRNSSVQQGSRLNRGWRGRGFGTPGRGTDIAVDEQNRDVASTSGRQFVKGRLKQRQKSSLSSIQQLNRSVARNDVINKRRGIGLGMKTSGNLGAPLRVRVGSGTIVRGLRSDQLLLQKIKQSKKKQVQSRLEKLEAFREKRDRSQNGRDSSLESNSVVSLSSHRGLTVSIKNNMASQSVHNGTTSRSQPRLSHHKSKKSQDDIFAPATFTIVNDRINSYDSDFEEIPDPTRRITKRNIITTRDARPRNTVSLSVGADNVRSLPEPHRQILDPKIQKEIAMLQGKEEVTLNSGPGPGVKGFRHIPSQTTRSLNERFTNERLVTV